MKIHCSITQRAISVLIILIGFTTNGFAADDPDELLKWYLETGSSVFADKLREGYPGTPYTTFCDAWEYLGANDERARELASTLVQDHPDFAAGHFALAAVLTTGFKEYTQAIPIFNRSLEILPDFRLSYQYRGIAKIGLSDFEGAREDFNKLLKLKRGYAVGFLLRGVANHGLGNEEEMKADFEIGLQLNYMALSTIPGDLAEGAMDKAIETSPDNAIYYFARGYADFVKGNYRPASQDFSKCIDLVPGSSDFYKYSGASKIQIDDFEGGQKDLNFALSVNPDDPDIYYYLGVLMNDHLKQSAMAQEYLNHAINLDESNALYFYERSKAAFKMLDFEQARDDINRALQLEHRKGDFYAQRGNVKMKMGSKADDYCPDFRKALEWGTSYNLKRVMKKSCQ